MHIIIDGVEHVNPRGMTVVCDPAGEDVPPFTVLFAGGVCRLETLSVTGDANSPLPYFVIAGGPPAGTSVPQWTEVFS